ncbi:disks large-associated protein 5 [Gracilinanus agilis]|uniref:disks large-associated protein 5 n=1 Tax=Gracilinanus agilis TaxID=191870 RepID=UPI001CFF2AE9|nr:disks large-associated protein 5 [Gracilinanus agilis]
MASLSVPNHYRRDASTEMIRTKIAHRKSITWKENRHKKYEQKRHFGLLDVNTTTLEERNLPQLDETIDNILEKDNVKPTSTLNSLRELLSNRRKEMLQQYKERKQLQKMKEQRDKTRGGVFKVGLYKPDPPQFLRGLPGQKIVKPEPKKTIQTSEWITRSKVKDKMEQQPKVFQTSVRITRSKAKDKLEQPKIYADQVNNGHKMEAVQPGQKPTSEHQSSKERKVLKPDIRVTRSATIATKQIPKPASSIAMRRPMPKLISENKPERKASTEERPPPKIEVKADKEKILPSKAGGEENSSKDALTEGHSFKKSPSEEIAEFLGKEYIPDTNVASQVRKKYSFAPENFLFQPPDSLVNYRIKLISPQREYVAPNCFWSPLEVKDDHSQESKREVLKENKADYNASTQPDLIDLQSPPKPLEILHKDCLSNKNGDTTTNSDNLSLNTQTPLLEINEHQAAPPQHDVPYFRNILQSETERLTGFCHEWEMKLALDIPDDAQDLIRTTIGQTRLLISERFKQFEGLVNDCDYNCGQKKITCMDLDGFWDMVNFQVEDVNKKFEKLSKLQESEWQEKNTINQKVIRKKAVPVEKCKSKQDDAARTAARNRLAAIKASMKEKIKQEEPTLEIAVPGVSKAKEIDKIVFDAGFFRVESPVKSFSAISTSKEAVHSKSDDPTEYKTPGNKKRSVIEGNWNKLRSPIPPYH